MFSPASPQEIALGETLTFALTPDDGYEVELFLALAQLERCRRVHTRLGRLFKCSVHFNFDRQTHSVTPVVYRGQASFSPNGAEYPAWRPCHLHNNGEQQYRLDSVAQDCGGTPNTLWRSLRCINIHSHCCHQVAKFERSSRGRYAVTPSSTGNGTISPSTVQSIGHSERAVFTLSPNSGFEIDYFHPDWGSCGGDFPRSIYLHTGMSNNKPR